MLTGCHRDMFGACIATGIAQFNSILASVVDEQGDRKKNEVANSLKALHAVASCIEGHDSGVEQHLLNHTCAFMDRAQRHYQYVSFESNPVQEVDEAVQMRFSDWKGSKAGRQAKQKNGVDGLAHRKWRLRNLGFEEDEAIAKAEGRFSDAEKMIQMRKRNGSLVEPATVMANLDNFICHPEVAQEAVEEPRMGGLAATNEIVMLDIVTRTCGDPKLTTVSLSMLETDATESSLNADDTTVGKSSMEVEVPEVAAPERICNEGEQVQCVHVESEKEAHICNEGEQVQCMHVESEKEAHICNEGEQVQCVHVESEEAHHANTRSFLTPTTRELPNASLAERRMEVQKNIVPTKLWSQFATFTDKGDEDPNSGVYEDLSQLIHLSQLDSQVSTDDL
ncbi:unnamed protein product [Calypogeia fissa]